MRDGVRLAVDAHLPIERSGERLPTILRQTRYYRGISFREPFRRLPIEWLVDHAAHTRNRFVANGFAWVDVCVRGSGASFGNRPFPWSPDETADGSDIVDWVLEQPWANGKVGTTGVSYDGTTAEMLLVNKHPAVRACAPRFSLYDTFTDVAFPGGIHLAWFTDMWSRFNRALDGGELDRAFAMIIAVQLNAFAEQRSHQGLGRVFAKLGRPAMAPVWRKFMRTIANGVTPVTDSEMADAVEAHQANLDVHTGALDITFRDDPGMSTELEGATIDTFSPHTYQQELEDSGVPILSLSGWFDGAYQHSAIKRFRSVRTPGSQLIIGPWDHGGMQNVSPFCDAREAGFDQDGALVRFFAHHLRGEDNGVKQEPPVRYFTMGSERWSSGEVWPPPDAAPEIWYCDGDAALTRNEPSADGADVYDVDDELGTGRRSRWVSLLGLIAPVGYSRRREAGRRMLVYRSAPLAEAMSIAGHPLARLHVSSSTADAHIFIYLEDEFPDGHVEYITEGQLRALHRKVAEDAPYDSVAPYRSFDREDALAVEPGKPFEVLIDLLPTAWRVEAGHRLRLAIAGADKDHFAQLPARPTLTLHRGGNAQLISDAACREAVTLAVRAPPYAHGSGRL